MIFNNDSHSQILANSPPKRKVSKLSTTQETSQQLELFPSLPKLRKKAQISSIPGISPKERNRYRVVSLNGAILGDRLSLDEALQLTKRGGR